MPFSQIGEKLFALRGVLGFPFFFTGIVFENPDCISVIIGFSILFLGEIIRILSVAYSGPTTRARTLVAPRLVTNGPYGYVRNPLYIGNFLIGIGFLLATKAIYPWLQILLIPLFFIEYTLIVKAEERFLEKKFGEEYLDYKKSVGRFIPKFRKYRSTNPVKPDFKEALKSEKSTFYLILSLTCFFMVRWILSSYFSI